MTLSGSTAARRNTASRPAVLEGGKVGEALDMLRDLETDLLERHHEWSLR
jgi:hypothetical protein